MIARPRPLRAGTLASVVAVVATLVVSLTGMGDADESKPHRGARELFVPSVQADFRRLAPGWRDAAYLVAAGASVAIVAANDETLADRVGANDSESLDDLAKAVEPLGKGALVAAGVVAWGAAWRWAGDDTYAAVQRADLSVASAGVLTLALGEIVGRKRPEDSPGDASQFDPFSGADSFPSTHATLAFAAAAALDRETRSRWVPAIAYPLAGLVGWSRIREGKHWPSDVVAGAALGFGVAWKAEDVMRPANNGEPGARLEIGAGNGALAAVRLRW